MKHSRHEKMRVVDVSQGDGLAIFQSAQLYERKPARDGDWLDETAVRMRPRFVRAVEWMVDQAMIVVGDQPIAVAANRRVVVGNTTSWNSDVIAMAVNPDALDGSTDDVRVLRYWDFQTQYDPSNFRGHEQ